MLKAPLTKEVGTKINKKDKAVKNGQMVHFTKVLTSVERNMVMAFSNGQTVQNIMENGVIIKCTDTENSTGQMAESIKVNTVTTKNMVKVYIPGLMGECTKVGLVMENNTEKEFTNNKMANKYTVYG